MADPVLRICGSGINMQPAGHHLAELNFGELRYDWDDPRVAEFVDGLDMVNAMASRSPGFVWRLSDDDMNKEQTAEGGAFGGIRRMASTLSVWEDAASLEHFFWNTPHRQFYENRAQWHDSVGNSNLVVWWVPVGQKPKVKEGLSRFAQMQGQGQSHSAPCWDWVKGAIQSQRGPEKG